jgi:hypothetical protein
MIHARSVADAALDARESTAFRASKGFIRSFSQAWLSLGLPHVLCVLAVSQLEFYRMWW